MNTQSNDDSHEVSTSEELYTNKGLLREKYGEVPLKIVRYALIAHSSAKPIKKRDLIQAIKPANSELPRKLFTQYLSQAKAFLKDKLGMAIVELGTVKLRGSQWSPSRDELMVISLSHSYRSMFNKVSSKHQLHEWGIMCFVLILIVLKSDGIPYSTIRAAFTNSKMHMQSLDTEDDTSEIEAFHNKLMQTMQKLVAQRVFEVVKSEPRAVSQQEGHNMEPEDIYFIGPYAKYLVKSRELYQMILRMHYSKETLSNPEFSKQYIVAIRSLKQKFESTCLGSIGIED